MVQIQGGATSALRALVILLGLGSRAWARPRPPGFALVETILVPTANTSGTGPASVTSATSGRERLDAVDPVDPRVGGGDPAPDAGAAAPTRRQAARRQRPVSPLAHDLFRHRLILSYEAHAEGVTADQIVDRIVEKVAVA
jgi:hypothetical protein